LNGNVIPHFEATLAVAGGPPHWSLPDGSFCSYEPYVREMRVWADLFSEVIVCAPEAEGPLVGNQASYERDNVEWRRVVYPLHNGAGGKLLRLRRLAGAWKEISKMIDAADVVLLRSPDHLSLIGALLVRSRKRISITKWAGENGHFPGERLPSRLQRILESIPASRNVVLVYGPPRRPHQISFPPALMDLAELDAARNLARQKKAPPPWRILSVGRLDRIKGFDLAIEGLGVLRQKRPELDWTFTLIGDGVERGALERLAAARGIADRSTFLGALGFGEVQKHYARAHLAVMPGIKEGWPKVIGEAWAHGVLPLAASAGLAPWILSDPASGMCFDPSPDALWRALSRAMTGPESVPRWQEDLPSKARELSLELFRTGLCQILTERLGLTPEYCETDRSLECLRGS
jgi:glycosyltransferase involved in cell wall biosynthesis